MYRLHLFLKLTALWAGCLHLSVRSSIHLFGQSTYVVDFENIVPPGQDYLNGSEQPFGTTYSFSTPQGLIFFPNVYDTLYGGFWVQGWALSRRVDSSTATVQNVYGVKAYSGNGGSQGFAVGLGMARLRTHALSPGARVKSLYLTNTTWNYEAMRQGLGVSKKFGGQDGTDPDFFKVVVKRYVAGALQGDSAELYLADFRFPGASAQDYILNTWEKLELNLPTPMDSLLFILRSSDVGLMGMNTPPYFAVDDVEIEGSTVGLEEVQGRPLFRVRVMPDGRLWAEFLEPGVQFKVFDAVGRLVLNLRAQSSFFVSEKIFSPGLYIAECDGICFKFVVP